MRPKWIVPPLLLTAVLVVPSAGRGADWPDWRGPDLVRASAGEAPLEWGPDENVRWKVSLPAVSGSTPIVVGDRIYLNVSDGEELTLWSVRSSDGEVLWRRHLDDGDEAKRKGNLSSPSPVGDGSTVWTVTGTGVVAAFDADGEALWRRSLQDDYGPFGILHGYASSPLLHEGRLYVQVLHGFHTDDPSYLLALDAASGETIWRVERPTDAPKEAPDAYTTPTLLHDENGLSIVVSGADYVTAHDPSDGREIWRLGGLNPTANPMQRIVASPTVAGDRILVPSRVDPLTMLDAGGEGPPEVLWRFREGPDVPTPVVAGDRVYILRDRGIAICLDATTGEVVWGPERVGGDYSASPLLLGDRIYVTNEDGVTTVLAARDEFEVLARNEIGEYTLSSPVAAGGTLYLRTADHLWAIGSE